MLSNSEAKPAPPVLAEALQPSPAHAARDGRLAFAPGGPPRLAVIVDTEEEFDWSQPFTRTSRSVQSIAAQSRAQDIFDRYGVRPTYVVDQCVIESDKAVETLSAFRDAGAAEIGAHLQPWVNEPYLETVNDRNTLQCNLPEEIERAKMQSLTAGIAEQFGASPRVFKAGRYGYGPSTTDILLDLDYEIDCSFVPYTDYRRVHGPSFLGVPDQPFWIDRGRKLMEAPLSRGFCGAFAGAGPSLAGLFDSAFWTRIHVGGVLARTGLLERVTLTPEGVGADAQIRLMETMMRRGATVFTLTYHSPSLEPGYTPYVRDRADLDDFLGVIEKVCKWFADQPGARFTTLSDLRRDARAL